MGTMVRTCKEKKISLTFLRSLVAGRKKEKIPPQRRGCWSEHVVGGDQTLGGTEGGIPPKKGLLRNPRKSLQGRLGEKKISAEPDDRAIRKGGGLEEDRDISPGQKIASGGKGGGIDQ